MKPSGTKKSSKAILTLLPFVWECPVAVHSPLRRTREKFVPSLTPSQTDLGFKMQDGVWSRRKNCTAEKPFWNSVFHMASHPSFQISLPAHTTSCSFEMYFSYGGFSPPFDIALEISVISFQIEKQRSNWLHAKQEVWHHKTIRRRRWQTSR